MSRQIFRTATHWGAYDAEVENGRLIALHPFEGDPDPSPIGRSMPAAVHSDLRIAGPMVRQGWLEHGPRAGANKRGGEPFVAVPWDRALDLVAGELRRVKEAHGNAAIYAGSPGWASAGRFHHAMGQLHRFMNMHGGYTASVNSYSLGAAEVILKHVVAPFWSLYGDFTSWPVIAENTDLVVMFGGMALKNSQVDGGGAGRHTTRDWLRRCRDAGVAFVNIGPLDDDAADFLDAKRLVPRPNTDTAIMLGIAHTLVEAGLHDEAFLARYCVGFERFQPYLMGESDGQPKDAVWAAAIAGLDPAAIRALAVRMASGRTLISVSWSVQRGDHGEQPYWMAVTLAAMVGQIGLPGGGFGFGYGAVASVGNPARGLPGPSLAAGVNAVEDFIPVARIADLLLNPGGALDYDGRTITYPDVRLVYWCGGNVFHHHQDLNRLLAAWQRPETVIVHEPWWNPMARHADIVLPCTTTLERNDIGCSSSDNFMFAMQQAVAPVAGARNDFDIFSAVAARMGFGDAFTEGRNEMDWLRTLYNQFRQQAAQHDFEPPGFDDFWEAGHIEYGLPEDRKVLLADFRADPVVHPLATPSGRIEIFSKTIDGFGYDDCPGHPMWLEPAEWLGAASASRHPLHLISNQPKTRLHSQYDLGEISRASKVAGREAITINPIDAAERGISAGDVVRVFNERGACLAGAVVSAGVAPRIVLMATGAWYDPLEPGEPGSLEVHGNPNVLTMDKGTSRLAQAPSALSVLVEIERFEGEPPPVRAFDPPPIVEAAGG
jgi:biotin/methionine sulfoxide reductase